VASPQIARHLEGQYLADSTNTLNDISSNVTDDDANSNLKEYISTKTMVLSDMIMAAELTTNEWPTVLIKPKPKSKELVQQGIRDLGSEQAYLEGLEVCFANQAKFHTAEFAEATGKMLKADRNNRRSKVTFNCCPGCTFKFLFELSTKKHTGHK
jgi:hypothetical protein